jgi:superfamily I DNA/RNA helicase
MTVTAQGPGLTDEQRAAVEWADGPLMVLAGAGTGKTTVVVERVRHLLGRDPTLRPENILVLTYNVRAAAELVRRLERALGLERASQLWVHNFHSFGHRLLTAHRAELGLADTGHMLDPIGQRLILRDLRPRMGHFLYHDLALNPDPVLGRFAELISRAKDELLTPSEFAAYVEGQRKAFVIQFGEDAWGEAVESIRQRRAENTLAPIWEVRSGLRASPQEGAKSADRAARRTAAGINCAVGWNALTPEQRDLAVGLEATYLRDAAAYEVLRLQEEAEVYDLYQRTLHESGLVDFGEQQLRTIELLRDRPNLLLRYQTQFRHVLVDEFQDANMAQIQLLELVGRGPDKPDNVVVVGDDDQSIYRFRGASYAAFSQFESRFARPPAWAPERPTRPVISLPLLQNRRSTEAILAAANRLIAHNAVRLKSGQALHGIREEGIPVEVAFARDEADEADLIVERLQSAFEELPVADPLEIASSSSAHYEFGAPRGSSWQALERPVLGLALHDQTDPLSWLTPARTDVSCRHRVGTPPKRPSVQTCPKDMPLRLRRWSRSTRILLAGVMVVAGPSCSTTKRDRGGVESTTTGLWVEMKIWLPR